MLPLECNFVCRGVARELDFQVGTNCCESKGGAGFFELYRASAASLYDRAGAGPRWIPCRKVSRENPKFPDAGPNLVVHAGKLRVELTLFAGGLDFSPRIHQGHRSPERQTALPGTKS